MVTIDGLPVYRALVDDPETGMYKISLVDDPAVESLFQKFSAERRVLTYRVEDEERRIVRGVVMRADFPIYRRDPRFGEYYIVYTAETIRVMAEKYLLEGRQNAVNLQHEDGSDVEGVQMVQCFIKDTAAGISPEGFGDIADGSLFAEFHVVNDEVWEAVKEGTYRGFSLEGVFSLQPEQDADWVRDIVARLRGIFSELKTDNMGRMNRLKEALARMLQELGSVTTDRGALQWDGEDDLRAGMDVYTGEGEDRAPAPDGDYRTEDGKVIRVENGKVAEIRDDSAEVAGAAQQPEPARDPEPEPERSPAELVREALSKTYDEKQRLIYEALSRLMARDVYFYLAEAADDYAVAWEWNGADDTTRYMRYALTWENDVPVPGEAVEVRAAFIPVDMEVTFEEVSAERDSLRAELEEVRAELERLRAEPLARPAHEEVKGGASTKPTGNRGLDRLARYLDAGR